MQMKSNLLHSSYVEIICESISLFHWIELEKWVAENYVLWIL